MPYICIKLNKITFLPLIMLLALAFPNISQAQTVVDFKSDTTKGCAPLTVNFEDASSIKATRYKWSFGNGNYSYLKDPKAIYYQPGVYEVSLTVTDSSSKVHTKTRKHYIRVFKTPIADFSGSPLSGCVPFSIDLDDKVTLGDTAIAEWIWDFGDGNTQQNATGTHTYGIGGKFDVSLVVVDHNRCEDKISKVDYVNVLYTPIIDIYADKKIYCTAPLTVNFQDRSIFVDNNDTYLWDFGDGNTSNLKNPTHTFQNKGDYTITLTVEKPNGCKTTRTFDKYIRISNITPDFEADITLACEPALIKFTNKTIPQSLGISYRWEFGDNNAIGGVHTQHTYDAPGLYDVTLTATIDANCKETITKKTYINIVKNPTADFISSDTESCKTPLILLLTNSSSDFSKIEWYVDNQPKGNLYQTGATLMTFGEHEAMLIASNFVGCKDTMIQKVIIEPLEVAIEADTFEGCEPLTVTFTNAIDPIDPIVEYYWNFDDGDTTTGDTVTHTFSSAGTYLVQLKAISVSGCEAEAYIQIRVGKKTNPSFELRSDSFCNNVELIFKNTTQSNVPIHRYSWRIDGEEFSDLKDGFLYLSNDSGWLDVELITYNNGCPDTFSAERQIYVNPPHAKIEMSDPEICTKDPIIVKDVSQGADSISWRIYNWNYENVEIRSDSVLILDSTYHGKLVTLHTYNFTSNCIDSAGELIVFPLSETRARISLKGKLCAPSTMVFNATDANSEHSYTWIVNGDTTESPVLQNTFINPGPYSIFLIAEHNSNSCVDVDSVNLNITGPTVDGELIGDSSCAPVPIQLKNNSALSQFEDLFWIVDGDTVHVVNNNTINDTLEKPGPGPDGLHIVQLFGIDSNGCQGRMDFPLKVSGLMNARIKVNAYTVCAGNRFKIQLHAPGTNTSELQLHWDFGDGTTDTFRVVDKVYPDTGAYEVVLTVTQPNGCITKFRKIIDIYDQKVHAIFDADSLETACPPLFVQFNDVSVVGKYPIKSYFWDFGDSSYSVEQNPSKLYLKAGRYTVSLIVIDESPGGGCSDTAIYKDFVIVDGPTGSYDFDKKEGCVPLAVTYVGKTIDAQYYEWDMGDGTVVEDIDSFTHIYLHPGRYIPLLILSDTLGCSYTLPPIDTIYVDPYPIPEFDYDGICYGDEISFLSKDSTSEIPIDSFFWEFIQGDIVDTSNLANPKFVFDKQYNPTVRLTVFSPIGCSNTLEKDVDLNAINAVILPEQKFNCVGTELILNAEIESDTSISKYHWYYPDGDSLVEELRIYPKDTGVIPIKVILTDAEGCIDSSFTDQIIIGDTSLPLDIEMLRVSVVNDNQIVIDHKKSSQVDFFSYKIYSDVNGSYELLNEQSDRNITSFIHSGVNTLTTSQCYKIEVQNTCGLLSDTLTIDPHCSIEVGAKGVVNAIELNWNHYTGWADLERYDIYRESLSITGQFDLIGAVAADSNHYTDSAVNCYIEHRYRVQGVERNGNTQISWSDTCAAEPIWENVLLPNTLIRASVVDDEHITIDWSNVPSPIMPIVQYVLEKSSDGINYQHLGNFDASSFTTEDFDVLVDDQSYFYRSYAIDQCGDTSPMSNFGKTILLHASTDSTLDQKPILDWTTYQGWTAGVSYYTIEIENEDGSFTEVGNTNYQDTAFKDEVTNLNQRPEYCYRIIGHKVLENGEEEVISISNEDCSPVKSLLWIPNAFSPNRDNLNDKFVTPGIYIKEYHIRIFNRWGELIFESFDYYDNWDGTYKDEPAQQDAYMVIIETVGVDEVRRQHAATVTLLR